MQSELVSVAVYEREIAASLERIWENVLDWEHLPGLHRNAFSAIECLAESADGWRARMVSRGVAAPVEVEVRLERARLRYVTETVGGAGKGSAIWTELRPSGAHSTGIRVEFLVPGVPEAQRERVGRGYLALYAQLWDEDEAMMVRREAELARLRAAKRGGKLSLGPAAALRARAPLCVELGGRSWRIAVHGGSLVVHAAWCPHWLGPLELATSEGDVVECPWHRYRFDVRSGRSCDGRGLRLATAPRLEIDEAGDVLLVEDSE